MRRPDAGNRPDPGNLRPGEALNLPEHDLLPPKTPVLRYMVLSSPRTGSNALCRRLCNITGRFGLPSEYINGRHIALMSPRATPKGPPRDRASLERYLDAVERLRTSDDRLFGLKAQPRQITAFTGEALPEAVQFARRFDRLVLLTRKDKLGQAISGAIARVTQVWFNDGTDPDISPEQQRSLMPVITQLLKLYQEEERFIRRVSWACGKPCLHVDYEDIVADSDSVLRRVTDFLSPSVAGELREDGGLPTPEKPEGKVARQMRTMFLAQMRRDASAAPRDA